MPIKAALRTLRVKQYALLAHERGRAIEVLAKNIQQRTSTVADYGYEIEEYALVRQYHAQRALMYASLQEQGFYSTDLDYGGVSSTRTSNQSSGTSNQSIYPI